jgi:hypothetical protein
MKEHHAPEPISHLFQIQLHDTQLSQDQVERIASTIRAATAKELSKMDFRIDELTPLFGKNIADAMCSGCGGSCQGCHVVGAGSKS